MKANPTVTVRLFKNSFLEGLTHVHPMTPAVVWVPIISFFYWRALSQNELPLIDVIPITFLGLFVWSLSEYRIHRFLFHCRSENWIVQAFTRLFHGIHHELPNDRTRLLMPPAGSILLAIPFYFLFYTFLGPQWCDPFFAGFTLGYLIYDYTHYFTHFSTPKTAFGKALKSGHMKHHFISDRVYYGVSSPFWDYVFGTTSE